VAKENRDDDKPNVLSEGLLSSGLVRLFGRPFGGLKLGDLGTSAASNNPLATALRAGATPTLARVYGFSYLGNYYKLAEPLVFLVFGEARAVPPGATTTELGIDVLGIEFKDSDFPEGVFMWHVDQLDITIRIDIRIGWIKDLLLSEMSGDSNITGGDTVRRADIVGRDGNLVGRDGNLIGRGR
jgi:hypothetical protein